MTTKTKIIIVVVAVIVLGIVGYYFYSKKKKAEPAGKRFIAFTEEEKAAGQWTNSILNGAVAPIYTQITDKEKADGGRYE